MSSFDTIETRVLSKGELGQVVRYLREIRQWSQETLAELARTTPRTIQRVEAGSGGNLHTLRSLASAFEFKDIDAFTKPMAIPTNDQLQAARDKFEKEYVLTKVLLLESGRNLANFAAECIGDYIELDFDPNRDQAETFAELVDYFREYRDCTELYSSTSRLAVFDELQALLDRLADQGVTFRYVLRKLVSKDESDPNHQPRPVGDVLYLMGYKDGQAPEEIALPKRMSLL